MVLTTTSLMPSKSGALVALLSWALLATMSTMAQDTDTPWFWIMADSKNSTPVCPGRCLAVNDTATPGDFLNKPVGFVACKTAETGNSDSSSSSTSTNNQQWLHTADGTETETTIQINATDSTDTQSPAKLLCLQPDPAKANRRLVVTTCTGRRNQKWIVANNFIASLAFNPARYLAMTYKLADILNPTEGTGWREAWIVQSRAQNSSETTTFSMVDGTVDPQLPPPSKYEEPPQSRNFIRNGGFEQSSFDFSRTTSNLSLTQNDIFGLCDWQIMKTAANLQGGLNPAAAEGNRSLYLNDGIVKQSVATSPGGFYTLVFKVHVASPSPSDSTMAGSGDGTDNCKGSDTLSVNPYPSTNVHVNVPVNGSWAVRHVSFQSLGPQVLLSLRGCAACGCFLDDLNLMQIIDRAPFPPPPPRPSPPQVPGRYPDRPDEHKPPYDFRRGWSQNRLSNWAVVGLVVGASALFFMIGAAFFAVVCVKEKKESVTDMRRPAEWSITTTPVQSERGRRSGNNPDSLNAPTTPTSAPQDPSPRTSSMLGATRYSTSQPSSNPQSGSGA